MRITRRTTSPQPPVQTVTGVRRSLTDDIRSRQGRYLVSMGVRTACFALAFLTRGWLQVIFFVGAIALPYVAVVIANAGREPAETLPPPAAPAPREIGPGPSPTRMI